MEHFHEITDIAAMPEAPKDTSDIALAAYAQIQSLTEIVNEFMRITPEKQHLLENAMPGKFCDRCQNSRDQEEAVSAVAPRSPSPPPIPPPKKQMAQAQQQIPAPSVTKRQISALGEGEIHENDDGYCEIDELRLPVLYPLKKAIAGRLPPAPPPPPPPIPSKCSIQPIGHEGKELPALPPLPALPQKSTKAVTTTVKDTLADSHVHEEKEAERSEVEKTTIEDVPHNVIEGVEEKKRVKEESDVIVGKEEDMPIDVEKEEEKEEENSLLVVQTANEACQSPHVAGKEQAISAESMEGETICAEESNEKSLDKSNLHLEDVLSSAERIEADAVSTELVASDGNVCNELIVINENYETLVSTSIISR